MTKFAAAVALTFLIAAPASAQAPPNSGMAQDKIAKGQVTNVDEPSGKITIQMDDGRSQAFRPQDGLLFSAVQAGDHVTFSFDQVGGEMRITKLEKN